jgi:4-hydroxybenzoate polyprenyltransferase
MIAFNALLIAMSGFFLVSADQKFLAFPTENIWFILIGFSIFANMKDLKDTKGDRQENIKTLPVFFGQEKAKKIIAVFVILFLLIFSFYKQNNYLLFFSVFFSLLFYLLIRKKVFKEIYFFYLFFLYMIVVTATL